MRTTSVSQGRGRVTRLRFAILSVFCSLLAVALGVTSTYTYVGIGKIIDESSRDNINKTQKTIIDQISSYFGPVFRVTQIGAWFALKVPGNPLDNPSLHSFMMGALVFIPQSSYIYMADTQGNFFGLFSVGHTRVTHGDPNKPLPHGAKIVLERSRANDPYRLLTYMDDHGRVLWEERVPFKNGPYDPRTRPWYKKAKSQMKAIWSEPYQNWDDNELALTATSPLINPQGQFIGVMGADIPLRKVSGVLAKQKASRSGINFLINSQGGLLGYPVAEKVFQSNGISSILTVDEASVRKAYDEYQQKRQPQFVFKLDGLEYLAYFSPFPKTINNNWVLGMVAPSEDFTGPVKRVNQEVFYISVGILFLAIFLLIIFSHRISYPIEVLAEQMRRLKDLDIVTEPLPESHLQEISQMEEAMKLVKEGLSSFSKYVPKELVLSLIQTGSHKNLGGEVKKLTIFFSDIESFTSISEKLPSDQLMTYISCYFNELSGIILAEKGTIDKFIGDSIMAFWGAPKEDSQQVLHGCRAALRCHQAAQEDPHFFGPQRPSFKTRFGLHHAEVIVGNVGSSDRMNYTIFGDGVNVASRLEGINKIYGTHILVTQDVVNETKDHFLFRIVDKVAFQGRQMGSLIFELVQEKSNSGQDTETEKWVHLSGEAFEAYQNAQFEEALGLYEKVNSLRAGKDPVAAVFMDRCQLYHKTPPPNWDGVFRAQSK